MTHLISASARSISVRSCRGGALLDSLNIRQFTGQITGPATCPDCGADLRPVDATVTGGLIGVIPRATVTLTVTQESRPS